MLVSVCPGVEVGGGQCVCVLDRQYEVEHSVSLLQNTKREKEGKRKIQTGL